MYFCCLLIFFKSFFFKIPSGIPSECHTAVWILIRSNILSGLTWVQTGCKGYQQMTPVGKELTLLQGEIGEKKRERLIKKNGDQIPPFYSFIELRNIIW